MKTFQDYFQIVAFATPETNVRLIDSANVPKTDDVIFARLFDWKDVMHLICADSILTRNGIYVQWYVPYKPFARQDRTTALNHTDESHIFRDLIFGHLDDRIIFLDVHSENHKCGKQIHQFEPIRFYEPFGESRGMFGCWNPNFHLIVPDSGAAKKVPKDFVGESTYCEKTRDPETGRLSGFIVPTIKTKKQLVLVDDICDGGGTFIGIAENLQQYRKKNKLTLYVTHGLFTKGFDELLKYFDQIVTTNSVLNEGDPLRNWIGTEGKIKILDVLSDNFLNHCI